MKIEITAQNYIQCNMCRMQLDEPIEPNVTEIDLECWSKTPTPPLIMTAHVCASCKEKLLAKWSKS